MPIALTAAWHFIVSPLGRMLGAVLAVGALLAFVHHAGASAQAKKDAPKLAECSDRVATLNASLGRQNAAVQALQDDAARWVSESDKALAAAKSKAQGHRAKAAAILKAKPGSDAACVAADKLILENAG